MRKILLAAALAGGMLAACTQKSNNNQNNEGMNTTLTLTQEWDKVFPLSEKVSHKKVTFETQYGLTLAADLYTPKDAKGKLAAIAVSGPFGQRSLCHEDGRAWFCGTGFRPILHW